MDAREIGWWSAAATRIEARRRLHQIEAAAYPYMDEWDASRLVDSLTTDSQDDERTPDQRWRDARAALRRRVEGP